MYLDLFMDQLTDQLAQLESAELVRRLPEGDRAYFFKHALTQESAYESLLLKQRREIHRRVADAYEQLYPMHLDEHAALLAHHYSQAGDNAKTFIYAVRAGDAAALVFAYAEADAHYTQALDALTRLPDTAEHQKQRVDTVVKQVSVSLRTVGPAETLRRLAAAEAPARAYAAGEGATREDRLRLARVQYWQGHALIHQNETHAAIQQMRQVLQVAEAENDPQLLAIPASIIGRSLVAQGQFAKAVPVLSEAIAALEQVHDEHEWILATGFRGVAMAMLGDYAAGIAESERALARATESKTLTGIAFGHGALGLVHLFGNALAPGVVHARAMIDTAAESGDRLYTYLAYGFLAWADVRAGNCRDAEKEFEQAQTIAHEIGGQLLFADWFAAARAERALRCGQVERALALAAEIADQAQSNSSVFAEGVAERIRGQALAKIQAPRLEEAENHLAISLARFEQGGARLEAARARIAWSQVMTQRGNAHAAREQLEKAAAQFQVSGLTRELEQTRQLIDSLPR
jgi:hypothetical protein